MKITRQVFIDANIFTYLLTGHPTDGRSSRKARKELISVIEGWVALRLRMGKSIPPISRDEWLSAD